MSGEEQAPITTQEEFEEVFPDQYFVTNGCTGEEVVLVPGGASKRVTFANRMEYYDLAMSYRLSEFDTQVCVRYGVGVGREGCHRAARVSVVAGERAVSNPWRSPAHGSFRSRRCAVAWRMWCHCRRWACSHGRRWRRWWQVRPSSMWRCCGATRRTTGTRRRTRSSSGSGKSWRLLAMRSGHSMCASPGAAAACRQ